MNGLSDVEILQGLGYAGSASQGAFLAAVENMPAERKKAAIAKIVAGNVGGTQKSMRDLALERLDFLPPEIIRGLADKRLQIVDMEYYVAKLITNTKNVNFILDGDTITDGVTNLNNGKTKKDEWFLACGLQYQEGVGTSAVDSAYATAPVISSNGDFDLKANGGKLVVAERFPLSAFAEIGTSGGFLNKKNAIALSNPKWFEPQVKLEFNTRFAAATSVALTFGRVKIIGVSVITL